MVVVDTLLVEHLTTGGFWVRDGQVLHSATIRKFDRFKHHHSRYMLVDFFGDFRLQRSIRFPRPIGFCRLLISWLVGSHSHASTSSFCFCQLKYERKQKSDRRLALGGGPAII